jgi:hypothetical protein
MPRKSTKPQQLDLVDQANALPPIGHNSQVTDNDLIAENHKLEDLIKAAQAKFNEWAKPHKARIDAIENEIQRRLLERGADSTKTDAGTAYISNIMNQKVESCESLFDYVADHWEAVGADVKISVPVGVVRSHMEANEGRPPPGISISYFKRLNINRS